MPEWKQIVNIESNSNLAFASAPILLRLEIPMVTMKECETLKNSF